MPETGIQVNVADVHACKGKTGPRSSATGKTRTDRLLGLLLANQSREVPLSEIQALGSARNTAAKIDKLRRRGYVIANRTVHYSGGVKSFYQLIALPGESARLPADIVEVR